MPDPLRFHPKVVSDLSGAIAWYEERSAGLGERFKAAVDARFKDILRTPELFPRAFDDVDFRFARTHRFPYLVLYRIRQDIVYVLGVFHSASDPAKWHERASGGE
jgi:plasmid stabilization system protein ParE